MRGRWRCRGLGAGYDELLGRLGLDGDPFQELLPWETALGDQTLYDVSRGTKLQLTGPVLVDIQPCNASQEGGELEWRAQAREAWLQSCCPELLNSRLALCGELGGFALR